MRSAYSHVVLDAAARIAVRSRAVALGLALVLALAACASAPAPRGTYEALGGQDGIQAIVDDLLEEIVEDPRINQQFARTDIFRFREKLAEQLCAEAGGPCVYTGLDMREAHAGRGIDEAQFNAVVELLVRVMERRRVPVSAQNHLLRRLAPMRAQVLGRGADPAAQMPTPALQHD